MAGKSSNVRNLGKPHTFLTLAGPETMVRATFSGPPGPGSVVFGLVANRIRVAACERSGGQPMSESDHGQGEDRDLRARLDKLSSAIEKKRAGARGGDGNGDLGAGLGGETGRAMAQGFRIVTELAAGILVG